MTTETVTTKIRSGHDTWREVGYGALADGCDQKTLFKGGSPQIIIIKNTIKILSKTSFL